MQIHMCSADIRYHFGTQVLIRYTGGVQVYPVVFKPFTCSLYTTRYSKLRKVVPQHLNPGGVQVWCRYTKVVRVYWGSDGLLG